MNSAAHSNWNIRQRFAMAFVCLALVLLHNACSAQTTITPIPNTIADAAKPPLVTLTIQTNGQADPATTKKISKVNVGGTQVDVKPDTQGNPTFTPPANLSGVQQAQLLDKDGMPLLDNAGKQLGPIPLTYPSGGGANASQLMVFRILSGIAFLIVLSVFVYTIAKSILRSRATFRNPLGLPVGSFRAIIAYTLVAFLGFYVLNSILTGTDLKVPEALLGIVATVIGFYFGTRSGEEGGGDENGGIVRGIVHKDTPGSGASVSGAQVKFERDDGTAPYSRITDVDGRFVLLGAKAGKYKVSATVTGAKGQVEQLAITEGSDQEIEIVVKGTVSPQPTPLQTGTVQGTVTKSDGASAPRARVVLSQGGVEKFKDEADDPTGKYKIDAAVGEYDIEASLPPLTPSDKSKVKVASGGQQIVDLKLK